MPKPVVLSVNVDLTQAEIKLRRFEIRVARAVSFGATGRGSFVVGSAAFLAPSIASSTIAKGSPISRVQFTAPVPIDQTIRSLGMLGAVDLVVGHRIAGINEQLSEALSAGAKYRGEIRAFAAKGLNNPGAMNAMNVRLGTLDARVVVAAAAGGGALPAGTVPNIPTPSSTTTAKAAKRAAASAKAASIAAIASGRRFGEVTKAGRLTSLTTIAGLTIAAIAFTEDFTKARNKALRAAAESGDPASFSYTDVWKATASNVGDFLSDIGKGAFDRIRIGIAFAGEAVANFFILEESLWTSRNRVDAGLNDPNFRATSRFFASEVKARLDTVSGDAAERSRQIQIIADARGRAINKAIATKDEFIAKVARARANQALSIGFSGVSGAELEDNISAAISEAVGEMSLHEFDDIKVRPTAADQGGKKD